MILDAYFFITFLLVLVQMFYAILAKLEERRTDLNRILEGCVVSIFWPFMLVLIVLWQLAKLERRISQNWF